jgi:hypothetical protein
MVNKATNAVGIIAPSPLAGEGRSMLPRAMMGEGYCRNHPSPIRVRRQTIVPSPARGEDTRGDSGAASREEPTCGCRNGSPAPFHCFRIVIYNEWYNQNA